ncbi:hypothetical protein BHM03_00035071, partial [Ensete ventricosum]
DTLVAAPGFADGPESTIIFTTVPNTPQAPQSENNSTTTKSIDTQQRNLLIESLVDPRSKHPRKPPAPRSSEASKVEGDRDPRSGIRLGISEKATAIGGTPRDKGEEAEEEEVVAVSVLAQINGERASSGEREMWSFVGLARGRARTWHGGSSSAMSVADSKGRARYVQIVAHGDA